MQPNESGTSGTRGTDSKVVDIRAQLAGLTGNAKTAGNTGSPKPWAQHDPNAPADKAVNIRTNAYDRALIAFVAGLQGKSNAQVYRELLRKAALEAARG